MSETTPDDPLIVTKQLVDQLPNVTFVQLLRCIQIESKRRIGGDPSPENQAVRLVADADANFPANELSSWADGAIEGKRSTLGVTFFGLFGPSGALPDHYTQMVLERVRNKDYGLREFLNIFNHRMLSLFYLTWEKHAFAVGMETHHATGHESPVTLALRAIVGNRLDHSRDRQSFNDDSLLYYSGIFASCRTSQGSIRACVQDYTGIVTEVEPFVGSWLHLEPEDQSRIGSFALGENAGNQLGINSIAGDRVWDVENRFRIQLGPITWATLLEYLPTGQSLRRITDLVRRLVGPQWEFDFQMLLRPDEVRGVTLDGTFPPLLGWNTWLGVWNKPEPSGDAIFELPDMVPSAVY